MLKDIHSIVSACLKENAQFSTSTNFSKLETDFELYFLLFLSSFIDGNRTQAELNFIEQVCIKLEWSNTYRQMLQSKVDQLISYDIESIKILSSNKDLSEFSYRLCVCLCLVDGQLQNDEKLFLQNLETHFHKLSRETIEEVLYWSHQQFNFAYEKKSSEAEASEERTEELSLEDALNELHSLMGLESVKEEIQRLVKYLEIQALRKAQDLKEAPLSLHMVFKGNPGTGKTTVARILAQIFNSMKILKKGHLIETDRMGLVGQYVGHTAIKTDEVIQSALDGILFIDEAYSLVSKGNNDFGQEAIDTLVKRMEDYRDRLIVVIAGYPDEIEEFIQSNPGLRSRFSTYIEFENYKSQELIGIFKMLCNKHEYAIDEVAEKKLIQLFDNRTQNADKEFGNARFVRNLFEQALRNHAFRLSSSEIELSRKDLSTLCEKDFVLP